MRKILLVFVLTLNATNCYAENWTKVGTTHYPDNDNPKSWATFYIDMSSIVKQGENVKAKVLMDMKRPWDYDFNNKRFYSSVVRTHIYDCFNEKNMTRAVFYSGNMGQGKIIALDQNYDETWSLVELTTINEKLMRIACGTK
jgi:hypothetical protein